MLVFLFIGLATLSFVCFYFGGLNDIPVDICSRSFDAVPEVSPFDLSKLRIELPRGAIEELFGCILAFSS